MLHVEVTMPGYGPPVALDIFNRGPVPDQREGWETGTLDDGLYKYEVLYNHRRYYFTHWRRDGWTICVKKALEVIPRAS